MAEDLAGGAKIVFLGKLDMLNRGSNIKVVQVNGFLQSYVAPPIMSKHCWKIMSDDNPRIPPLSSARRRRPFPGITAKCILY